MNSLTKSSKPITKLLKPTSKTLYIALFSTQSSPQLANNNPSSSSSISSREGRYEEESRNVRVSVWWDIENCGVPSGVNVFKIAQSISSAVRVNGIKGPIQITAFGDVFCLNRANQEALSSSGVNLVHVPNGGKNSADRSLLVDLMYWVSQNPPPAHIFLISGDKDFSGILHRLRMSNYNILLAAKDVKPSPGVLYSSASIMWYWNELVKGENLSGKHFNQAPDGPHSFWYGHYRGSLEDPFAVSEQPKLLEAVKESSNAEQSSDAFSIRPVPMAVLRALRRSVNSHAEGLTITELRHQLINDNVNIDKDFYGYKSFSRFLMSLTRIVKVESRSEGQFFIHPVLSTSPIAVECNDISAKANQNAPTITRMVDVKEKSADEISVKKSDWKKNSLKDTPADVLSQAIPMNGNKGVHVTAKANRETPTITRMVDVKKVDEKKNLEKDKPAEEIVETKVLDASLKEKDVALNTGIVLFKPEIGLLKKLWIKLFPGSVDTKQSSVVGPDRLSTPDVIPEKSIPKTMQSQSSPEDEVRDPARSSSDTSSKHVAKDGIAEKSEASPGVISKVLNWCKFWKSEPTVGEVIESPLKEASSIEEAEKKLDDAPQPVMHELFAKDTFWVALRSFFRTYRGSNMLSGSLSREQIAERLQKEGPLFLQPLQMTDIRQLVDLLVNDKKWIKEFPNQKPRFRLISRHEENSSSPSAFTPIQPQPQPQPQAQPQTEPHNSPAGLSSMFLKSESCDDPQVKVAPKVYKKPVVKSRTEILADCQKLLDEALSENPYGLNIGQFKKQFLERYGYVLDHQKIGYPKLASLLQMMPGVRVDSSCVFPDKVVYAPGIQPDDVESPWEELGPVEKSNVKKEQGVYEPSVLEDDEFSETEADEKSASSFPIQARDQKKSDINDEESSLLQILDTWYGVKNDSNPEGSPGSAVKDENNLEDSQASAVDESTLSGTCNVDVKGEIASSITTGRKHKAKTYTFVADNTESKKDVLVDGILGSLKKTGEARV